MSPERFVKGESERTFTAAPTTTFACLTGSDFGSLRFLLLSTDMLFPSGVFG